MWCWLQLCEGQFTVLLMRRLRGRAVNIHSHPPGWWEHRVWTGVRCRSRLSCLDILRQWWGERSQQGGDIIWRKINPLLLFPNYGSGKGMLDGSSETPSQIGTCRQKEKRQCQNIIWRFVGAHEVFWRRQGRIAEELLFQLKLKMEEEHTTKKCQQCWHIVRRKVCKVTYPINVAKSDA